MDINKIYQSLVELGNDYADKNAAASLLEETRKPTLYRLARESNESSMSAKEAFAYAHADYEAHVESMVEARKEADRAKVKYTAAQVKVDLLRTEAANERAANRHAT